MAGKVVIFDADHTLYSIEPEHAYEEMFKYLAKVLKEEKSVVERAWREHVKNIMNSKHAKDPEKRSRRYSLYILLGQFGITNESEIERITHDALDIFWSTVLESLRPARDLKKVINTLKKDHILCVASDEFMDVLESKLNKAIPGWRNIFKLVITPEITKTMKPSRKYYSIILKKLNVKPEECVVVGDDWERDLMPAKQLGMKTILVNEKREGNPDAIISEFKEVMGVIKNI